ncbi:tRNA preQ1(34) S-adenosylmethionine ribosyltransferase-isomerase QueA, partial [bacterium]|nr:tRNA preQ1(34) S-adenosylmethionine ribosyltransferase-isomerase QueA [bacterium]
RDNSCLMVLKTNNASIEHLKFSNIIEYLKKGDLLVLNNTRVIPARLFGEKENTKGKIEVFLLRKCNKSKKTSQEWEVLFKPAKRVKEGTNIVFSGGLLKGLVVKKERESGIVKFKSKADFSDILEQIGKVPLPPYIRREKINNRNTSPIESLDRERYQTVYAQKEGAVAAPTAGLHFTHNLLDKIKKKGIEIVFITLHVGRGTFQPVRVNEIIRHKMHKEYYEINRDAAQRINRARKKNRRIFCVGTTTVRALEGSAKEGRVVSGVKSTDIFIYPGYKFKIADALITNFHLPKSTLLMLVCAFASAGKTNQEGIDLINNAYREAIRKKYRFYSFGDAMLLLK